MLKSIARPLHWFVNSKKKRHRIYWLVGFFLLYIAVLIYVTNPFRPNTIVRNPYHASVQGDKIILEKNFELKVNKGFIIHSFGFVKSGAHIFANVYFGSKKALGDNVDVIVDEIYDLRFNPNYPYLISGDHFSVLYPRSLGVFYLSALDPRLNVKNAQWADRQRTYLQTTAYVIDVFKKNGKPCTTIVPVGPKSVTCIDIYSYPSDAIYSVLYALQSLQTSRPVVDTYPMNKNPQNSLQTVDAARSLTEENSSVLRSLIEGYQKKVYDTKTGLVRKDLHLSGAKDIVKRESAFYDNVIYWKTLSLGRELGIIDVSDADLDELKSRIIKTFWYEKGGYFLEDQSADSEKFKYYSSDWLVVLFTRFLDPNNPLEQQYFVRSVDYIRKEKLAEPFGLKYQESNRATRSFFLARIFLKSYGGTAIWSFWGTEYTKLLIILARETGDDTYLKLAKIQLDAYSQNIKTYQGFPEVYNSGGKMLGNLFYKSVRQTGWVINFQQAFEMYQSVRPDGIEPSTSTL